MSKNPWVMPKTNLNKTMKREGPGLLPLVVHVAGVKCSLQYVQGHLHHVLEKEKTEA